MSKKIKSLLDVEKVMFSSTLANMLNATSKKENSADIKIDFNGTTYLVNFPVSPKKVLECKVRVSDKGNIKLKASLNKKVKKQIDATIALVVLNMKTGASGVTDYSSIKTNQWKALSKTTAVRIRTQIIARCLPEYVKSHFSI